MILEAAFITGLFALSGAAIGGVFSSWATFKLGERQRKLELYKLAYPEKFKVVTELMNRAVSTFDTAVDFHLIQNEETAKALNNTSFQMYAWAYTHEWLLDAEIVKSAQLLLTSVHYVLDKGDKEKGYEAILTAFRFLGYAVRQKEHIFEFERLFTDKRGNKVYSEKSVLAEFDREFLEYFPTFTSKKSNQTSAPASKD